MASNFEIDGVRFSLESHIPDEVMQAFQFISAERYAAGLEAGKATLKTSKTKAAVERPSD